MKMSMKLPFTSKITSPHIINWKNKCKKELKKPYFWFRSPTLFCLFALFLLPTILAAFSFLRSDQKLKEIEHDMSFLERRILRKIEAQKAERNFLKNYRRFNSKYLDQVLSSLIFLKPEVDTLCEINRHPGLANSPALKARMDALTSGENRMVFNLEYEDEKGGIKEGLFKQEHPVEVTQSDVEKILSEVEGVGEKPQFVVQYFDLDKKRINDKETYFLEMNLIERGQAK